MLNRRNFIKAGVAGIASSACLRLAPAQAQRREMAERAIERVGLADRMKHKPNELSGGQRQRVAIARALVFDPSIILADEPTGNLDSRTGDEIMVMLDELHAAGQTIILVTHEDYIAEHALRTIKLKDGLIESDDSHGNIRQAVQPLSPVETASYAVV